MPIWLENSVNNISAKTTIAFPYHYRCLGRLALIHTYLPVSPSPPLIIQRFFRFIRYMMHKFAPNMENEGTGSSLGSRTRKIKHN